MLYLDSSSGFVIIFSVYFLATKHTWGGGWQRVHLSW